MCSEGCTTHTMHHPHHARVHLHDRAGSHSPSPPFATPSLTHRVFSTQSRVGGKGTVRRKAKAVRKNATQDDKRLKASLNKLNVRDIPAIEEVNLFKDDGHVVHFANPKVQASIAANTYVISGNAQTKKLQELLPG